MYRPWTVVNSSWFLCSNDGYELLTGTLLGTKSHILLLIIVANEVATNS